MTNENSSMNIATDESKLDKQLGFNCMEHNERSVGVEERLMTSKNVAN